MGHAAETLPAPARHNSSQRGRTHPLPFLVLILAVLVAGSALSPPADVQAAAYKNPQAQPQPSRPRPTLPAPDAVRRATIFLRERGLGLPGQPLPAAQRLRARAQHAAMVRTQAATQSASPTVWQPIGPMQVNTSAWNLVTGPINSIAADPSDPSGNTVYLGTAGGGVWKSINAAGPSGSATFAPLTDTLSAFSSAALTSLSIGAVSVQPGGTGVLLAGTGDPNNSTDSWYGAGILRSPDGGNHWTLADETALSLYPLQSFSFLGSAFAGFAWSTTTPNLVVAAVTASGYGSIVGTSLNTSITGLYYSPDAGVSWGLATLQDGSNVFQSPAVGNEGGNSATSVVWNPIRQRFYAAIQYHGYYESSDGITWTRLAHQPGANLTTALCPTNPGTPGSPACPINRGVLAVQPVTGDMFALTVDQNNLDQGLWQDVCNQTPSGACASPTVQFGTQVADAPLEVGPGNPEIPDATYDLTLAAVPVQQDTVLLAGATDLWRCSLANSCAWRNTTNTQTCAAAQVSPAQHAIDATFGATGLLYFGNDGGLWRSTDDVNQQATVCSTDDATHFQNLNGALGSLAQVENFSEDPNNVSTWLAALGTLGTAAPEQSATVWDQVLNGDGDVTAIDPANPDNWYATSEYGVGINLCTQGTACNVAGFGAIVLGEAQVDNDLQLIPAPWLLDPENTANLILGTCRVWRGPANGAGWSSANLLSSMLDGDPGPFCYGNAEIRSLAIGVIQPASNGAEQLYAGMAGALDGGGLTPGHVFTASVTGSSQAATTTWIDRYSSPVVNGTSIAQFNPGGYDISSLYADPHDATGATIYVTIQGAPTAAHLYQSTDAGAHWTDITANLPPAPANSIVVDPNDANIVYVATDTGVYVTQNVGSCSTTQCWNVYASGLPQAPVTRLMVYDDNQTEVLRAATYGRGIWQANLVTSGFAPTAVTVQPDSLTFAPQPVQTKSAGQNVTVTNTGKLQLNITGVVMGGDFVESDNCTGFSVAPGDTCQIQVAYDPSQTGSETGALTVFGNVTDGQLVVPLSGVGLPPATVVLTPSALSFPATTVGAWSAPESITLANVGGETATITSISPTGDFLLKTNTCGNSLAPQSSCTLLLLFAPTADGARNGALTVVDSVGTQVAPLSGTGQTVATDVLTPLSLNFPPQQVGTVSAAQQITLTNTGDQPLTAIATATTGDFSTVSNCGTILQGNGSCVISVTYAPTVAGPAVGNLTVADELRNQTVSLSGSGLAPPGFSATPSAVSFGGWGIGTTSGVKIVTVANAGGSAIGGASAAIASGSGFAIVSNTCTSSMAVGAACEIGLTFSPTTAGTATGVLAVSVASLNKTVNVALSGSGEDFSMALSGSSTAVITSGQTAGYALQIAALSGISGTVALACTGAPQNASCSLNPSSIAISGTNTSSVTVTVATGVTTTSAARPGIDWHRLGSVLALAFPLSLAGFRRRGRAGLLLVLCSVCLLLSGCGVSASGGTSGSGSGGSGGSGGTQIVTPSGTYTITVTGTLSNITHTVQATLTVQ